MGNCHPSFAWTDSQNTPVISGINWYLPATKELRQLYAVMSGLKWVASGAGKGEINDWGHMDMPDYTNYSAARTTFNGKFTSAKGTPMELTTDPFYWSSTDHGYTTDAYAVSFNSCYSPSGTKSNNTRVRIVSAF